MKTRRTLFFSLLVFVLGLSLLMLGSAGQANAGSLTEAQWKELAGYIDGYIQNQYDVTTDTLNNEYGFGYEPATYKARVDTNSDGTVCGVGDDMKDRPILVDNLINYITLIPGTSLRNLWNSISPIYGGLSPAVLIALRDKVIAHRDAGFSTDISVY